MPNRHLKGITVAALAVGILIIAYTYKKYRMAPRISFPQLEVMDGNGVKATLKLKPGRPVIVVFFASWCHDCARELPKLARALQGPLQGAEVVALTDEDLVTMVRYRDETKYNFRFFALSGDFGSYGIHAIPTVYVLNAQGETVFTKVGDVDWNSPDLLRRISGATAPR